MRIGSGGAILLTIAAAFATPAAARDDEQFKRKVGLWEVSGSDGVCSAALIDMPSSVIWILVSPDAGNDGGIMMTTPRMLGAADAWITVTVRMGDAKPAQRAAQISDDPVGLYIPWKTSTEMAAMPDDWHFKITARGATLLDVDVHGFKDAVRTLNECDRVTDKNGMS